MLSDPIFFRQITNFSGSFHYPKKNKIWLWEVLIISHTIHIGSNWYMDTGVSDLEVAVFEANST